MTETLTTRSAALTVKGWIDNRAELPPTRSQRRWLLEQLAGQCAAEAIARGDDGNQLELLLNEAEELLNSVWYAAAPQVATKWWRDGEEPTDEEKKIISRAKGVIWDRHDPQISYIEGFESKQHFSCDKDSLNSCIAEYLSKPWLRHGVIDFIFIDMLITHELCAFGESIKETAYPTSNSVLGSIYNDRYYKAKGKLSELGKVDWNAKFARLNNWFWISIGFPLGAIWVAFHFDYTKTGWWIFGIWASLWVLEVAFFVLRASMRLFRRGSKPLTPYQSQLKLWTSMRDVWKLLEGPVVNPTRVRDAMRNSTDAGAVWDNSAWAIIDRVILRDPAVWLVSPQ